MALIQLSAFVTKIRGKISGSVFSANVAGATIRNKTIPKQAATAARAKANNRQAYFGALWLDMNPTYRAAWIFYSQSFLFYNKLGDGVAPKANLIFATTNLYYQEVTGNVMFAPQIFVTPGILDNVTIDIRHNTSYANINFATIFTGTIVQLYTSTPFHHGKETLMKSRVSKIFPLFPVTTLTPDILFSHYFWHKYPWARRNMYVWVAFRRIEPTCYSWSPLEYHLVRIST
jgi:hypothetical protein